MTYNVFGGTLNLTRPNPILILYYRRNVGQICGSTRRRNTRSSLPMDHSVLSFSWCRRCSNLWCLSGRREHLLFHSRLSVKIYLLCINLFDLLYARSSAVDSIWAVMFLWRIRWQIVKLVCLCGVM